jgi:hypothetical protein
VSTSVQILIKDERDSTSLAQEIARSLGANGFMAGQDGNVLSLDAQRWINSEGTGILDLKPVETVEEGEEGEYDDTAYAPYNHELVLEFRGPYGMARGELRELFGRALFDRLTGLGRPLAYGEVGGDLFADFLPDRGVRDFPPGTDYEEPGRSLWFEPRLHGTPEPAPSVDGPERLQGRGVVFESDGLLQVIPQVPGPCGEWRFGTPVAAIRVDADPARIGRLVIRTLGHPCEDPGPCGDPTLWVTGVTRSSVDSFSQQAVSIDVESDGDVITAVPHVPYKGPSANALLQGQASETLVHGGGLPGDDASLGRLLIQLTSAVRGDAGGGG